MTPEQLFAANKGLVGFVIARMRPRTSPYTDADDVYQDGLLGLWNAALTYRPACGAFSTYATACIRNEIKAAATVVFAEKRGEHVAKQNGSDTPSREREPVDELIVREERATLPCVMACFSPRRQAILRRKYVDDVTWDQVAVEFGYRNGNSAREATNQMIRKFRTRLKGARNAEAYLHRRADQQGRCAAQRAAGDCGRSRVDPSRVRAAVPAVDGVHGVSRAGHRSDAA